jgi:hypothetical protein
VADSKIWRRVLLVKNVRNFHQKSLQALLARLQLFAGLGFKELEPEIRFAQTQF